MYATAEEPVPRRVLGYLARGLGRSLLRRGCTRLWQVRRSQDSGRPLQDPSALAVRLLIRGLRGALRHARPLFLPHLFERQACAVRDYLEHRMSGIAR